MVDMRTREGRALRDNETREAHKRAETWKPVALLPDPVPMDGYVYRWVRTSTLGASDPTNVSARFREGWEPVPKEELSEMQIMQDHRTRFPNNMEVGGLLLCRMSAEKAEVQRQYYEQKSANQVKSADRNIMKENDPRMPLLSPQRSQSVTFGNGRPAR